jgi:cyanophycinase
VSDCEVGCIEAHVQDPTAYNANGIVGPARGWLVIDGGGLPVAVKARFVALAGGPNAKFVCIPTAQSDAQIGDPERVRANFLRQFGVSQVVVLHTRDRVRANSEGFVEPLRQASGVWIDGGRQWRLADAYLGTAVEREIKALLARGGVVGGSSAGATIQGSYLVRGASGTPGNPDGDNRIMMSPGHETGFGLLADSAIDQHINVRGREKDLDQVIAVHPNLLGIGIDQGAAVVVHGNLFSVMGGQVAIHDGKDHDGALYYFLSPGQTFDLKTRSVAPAESLLIPGAVTTESASGSRYPLTLTVTSAQRRSHNGEMSTNGTGLLTWTGDPGKPAQRITFECDTGVFSRAGSNVYPARSIKPYQIKIESREMGSDKVLEATCKY